MPRIPFPIRPALSLRARLAVLLGLLALVLIVDRAGDILARRADLSAATRTRLADLARAGAERQEDVISDARALLTLATEMPESSPVGGDACGEIYAKTAEALPWLLSLMAARPDGSTFCTSRPGPAGLNIADREYFRQAIATRGFVLSDFITLRFDNTRGLIAAMPRIVDGKVDSVILARLDVDWLTGLIHRLGESSGTTTVLSDGSGTIVASYPESLAGQSVTKLGLPGPETGSRHAVLDVSGPDGRPKIFAASGVPYVGGHVFVGADRDEILAPVWAQVLGSGLKLAGVLLICGSIAWVAVERLVVQPARKLGTTAVRFGEGDLSARADETVRSAEFARLASAFNRMAERLESRDAELRAVNDRLAELATVDALTGLANRRLFDERLAQEWRRSARSGRPLGLVLLDIDHFKAFNDTYGHPAGDGCLRQIAGAVASHLRPNDLAARIGGEEFAILMPSADRHRVTHVARLTRMEIEKLAIPHSGSPLRLVTASAGVASSEAVEATAEALVHHADESLYRAKRSGRNRVAEARADAHAS